MPSSSSPESLIDALEAVGIKPEDFLKRGNGERVHPTRRPSPRFAQARRLREHSRERFAQETELKIAAHLFSMQREGLLRVWIEGGNVLIGPYDGSGDKSSRRGVSWHDARKIASRTHPQYLQKLLKPLRSR